MVQKNQDNPESQEDWIKRVGQEVTELLVRKDFDYGSSFAEQYNDYGVLSSMIRMEDKMRRLKNLIKGNKAKVEESIEDSVLDLCGYAMLTLVEMRKHREKVKDEQ